PYLHHSAKEVCSCEGGLFVERLVSSFVRESFSHNIYKKNYSMISIFLDEQLYLFLPLSLLSYTNELTNPEITPSLRLRTTSRPAFPLARSSSVHRGALCLCSAGA